MKKILISLLVLMLTVTSFAFPSAQDSRGTFRNGYAWGGHTPKDKATLWAQGIEGVAIVGSGLGTGQIFYVDSGVANEGDGGSWETAFDTLDEAINASSADSGANRGDFILVAQGHTEDITASSVDVDVAGLSIIGMGRGSLKPQFVWEVATGTFDVDAANILLENLRFVPSVTEVVSGVAISANGDFAQVIGCDFGFAELSGTDEFDTALSIAGGAQEVLVDSCFFHAEAAGAGEAIYLGTVSGVSIKNNEIYGDYATGCIVNVGTADDVRLVRNILFNGTMHGDGEINAVAAFSMAEGTGGYIGDNRFVTDVATALLMRIGDDMVFMNNYAIDTDGDEFSGGLESGGNTVTVTPVTGT